MTLVRLMTAGAVTIAVMIACAVHPNARTGGAQPVRGPADQMDPEIREILSLAAGASSSHNAQPWRVEISGSGLLTLRAEPDRYLPAADPENREMFLSFGAFLETLDTAARALGYATEISILADALGAAEIAAIRLEKIEERRDTATVNLLASVYTPKGDLGTDALDPGTIGELETGQTAQLRYLPADSAGFQWVRGQTPAASLQQAWRDPVQEELAQFLHFSKRSARKAGYGLTPEMMEVPPVGRFFWYTFMSRKSALSKSFRDSIEGITADQLDNCAGVFILSSADLSPSALIEAGRQYQRLKLSAFRQGIGIHPLSSLLEEEPWKEQVDSKFQSDRPVQFILRTGRLQGELPDFESDAITSASIRMRPEQFVSMD